MKKRICHLTMSYGNKNQSYTQDLLEGFQEGTTNIHFVYTHWKIKESSTIKVVESFKKMNFAFVKVFIKVFFTAKCFRAICTSWKRAELYKWVRLFQYPIDVLHIHHAHAISYKTLKFFKQQPIKIIISLRGRDLLIKTAKPQEAEELKKKLLLADHIHVISNYMNQQLQEKYNLTGKVVYRGQTIPHEKYTKKTTLEPDKPLRILVVGRLVWEKGHVYLLESIARLKQKGISVKVDIFGSGNLQEFLSYRIQQLGIEVEISLKGFVENKKLKKLYKNYDIFVQPSISEALSNALIDAMLNNLPCIITKVGGMPEIITHQHNGVIINPTEMDQLEGAILKASTMKIAEVHKFNQIENVKKFSRAHEIKKLTMLYEN